MVLQLFNTLTRKKETFSPIKKNEVGLYTCGPTIYSYMHIGNLRSFLFEDILKRTLLFNGYNVKHVMNITDVGHLTGENEGDANFGEDKMLKGAQREGKTVWEIASFYNQAFQNDVGKMNIIPSNILCKATDHIKEQIEMVQILQKKGFTYWTSDGVYFDTTKFKDYGKFAKLKKESLKAGARIELGEKKDISDFALWKFSPQEEKRQMEWDFIQEIILTNEEFEKLKDVSKKNKNIQLLGVKDV